MCYSAPCRNIILMRTASQCQSPKIIYWCLQGPGNSKMCWSNDPLDTAVAGRKSQDLIIWSDEPRSAFAKAQRSLSSRQSYHLASPIRHAVDTVVILTAQSRIVALEIHSMQ